MTDLMSVFAPESNPQPGAKGSPTAWVENGVMSFIDQWGTTHHMPVGNIPSSGPVTTYGSHEEAAKAGNDSTYSFAGSEEDQAKAKEAWKAEHTPTGKDKPPDPPADIKRQMNSGLPAAYNYKRKRWELVPPEFADTVTSPTTPDQQGLPMASTGDLLGGS